MNKDLKDFIIGSVILGILIFIVVLIILLVIYYNQLEDLKIPIDKYNISDYVHIEKVDCTKYNDVYKKELNVPKIVLRNVEKEVTDNFEEEISNLLFEIETNSKKLKEENKTNNIINVYMNYEIYDCILSIFYSLNIKTEDNKDYVYKYIVLNYNLETHKKLTNMDIVNKYDLNIDKIILDIIDKNIISNTKLIDKETNDTINEEYISKNKTKYIEKIKNNLNLVKLYYKKNDLNIIYNDKEILETSFKLEDNYVPKIINEKI